MERARISVVAQQRREFDTKSIPHLRRGPLIQSRLRLTTFQRLAMMPTSFQLNSKPFGMSWNSSHSVLTQRPRPNRRQALSPRRVPVLRSIWVPLRGTGPFPVKARGGAAPRWWPRSWQSRFQWCVPPRQHRPRLAQPND